MTALYIALLCLAIGIPAVLYLLYRSQPMRTASHRQIERETAEIQRNGESSWWKGMVEAVLWVVACLLIAGLVVPK